MKKRKVLIAAHHLTVGGAQKSMISALKAIDYEKNDVTLYVRKKRLALLDQVDKRVNVVINEDNTHYYRNIYSLWLLVLIWIFHVFHFAEKEKKYQDRLDRVIRNKMMDYEYEHYFKDKKYDVAISYIQGYTADLVAERIQAKRKYIFYHSSTDEAHDFHEEIFQKYDAIIAVVDVVKHILQKLYTRQASKIKVLYNYVDYEEVRENALEDIIHSPSGKSILCTCGRLSPVKGFDLAIKAAKILKDRGLDFLWYFVGDGPERNNLERMVQEYRLENNIVFAGMQANPYPWMRVCDIYVQPSYEESYGLTIAEAQILCKPVVSTKTVGGKYLVQDGTNGVVCEINEVALADSIQKLITSQEKREAITERLQSVDYAKAFELYKKKWEELLEG